MTKSPSHVILADTPHTRQNAALVYFARVYARPASWGPRTRRNASAIDARQLPAGVGPLVVTPRLLHPATPCTCSAAQLQPPVLLYPLHDRTSRECILSAWPLVRAEKRRLRRLRWHRPLLELNGIIEKECICVSRRLRSGLFPGLEDAPAVCLLVQ